VTTLKDNITRGETWERLLYVVLFIFICGLAEVVFCAVVAAQFAFVLLTGTGNQNLLSFGASLNRFLYDVLLFMTFNSDERPFPFRPWPTV